MINEALEKYIEKPECPKTNYALAKEYFVLGQYASAISFFIRAADRSEEMLKYKSLIRASICYDSQGRRNQTTEDLLLHAISECPSLPEAYYYISLLYEKMGRWREVRSYSNLCISFLDNAINSDISPKIEKILYQKAIGEWNVGLYEKSRNLILDIAYKHDIDQNIRSHALENLEKNIGYPDIIPYTSADRNIYRYDFPGLDSIKTNYSKHMQDMFVLSALNGKRNGTYLEIGSWDPIKTNNTYLFETLFDWTGISIEKDEKMARLFKNERKNQILCDDATNVDYESILSKSCMPTDIDYLQIDCDDDSLKILKLMPFEKYRFGVVQFEHDAYRIGDYVRSESRKILKAAGYKLVVPNVAFNEKSQYEDWWIHPDIVSINPEMISTNKTNFVLTYILNCKKEK